MPGAGARPDRVHGGPSGRPPGKGGKRVARRFEPPPGRPPQDEPPQDEPPEQRSERARGEPPPGVAGKQAERMARRPSGAQDGERRGRHDDKRAGRGRRKQNREQKHNGERAGKASGKQNGEQKQNGERNGGGGGRRAALGAAVGRGWQQRGARAALAAGLLALWGVAYFGVAYSPLVLRARHEVLPWDRAIPFAGWAVWIYLAGLPMIAAPLLLLRHGRPLRRVVLGYLVVIVVAMACFAAFPVASSQLRMAAGDVGLDPLTALALATLRALDPPFNTFPSLHVALGALAAWSMGDAAPPTRPGWNLALALVAWSVCAIKQHAVLDVGGGLTLALAVRAWVGAGAARAGRLSLPMPPMPDRRGRHEPIGGGDANRAQRLGAQASANWRQALARHARALRERASPWRRAASEHQLPRGADSKAFQSPSRRLDRNGHQLPLGGAVADRRQRLPEVANLNLRQALARYARSGLGRRLPLSRGASGSRHRAVHAANATRPEPTPPLHGRRAWLLGDANADANRRPAAEAGWTWRRALPGGARSHPGRQQPTPPGARPSWRALPLAALPLLVVFALFVVYYMSAA